MPELSLSLEEFFWAGIIACKPTCTINITRIVRSDLFPKKFRHLLSINYSLMLIEEAKVAVAPGLGFGEFGDEYVRFALVENVHRTNQAIRGFRQVLKKSLEELGLPAAEK